MPSAQRVLYVLAGAGDVPAGDEWLGPREVDLQRKMKVAKRRDDFRLGRFVAKQLLRVPFPAASLSSLEILPDGEGAPCCFRAAQPLDLSLSLSHRGAHGFAVIAEGADALGCDLELVEERSPAFMRDYFTEKERGAFAAHPELARNLLANLFWSAKESALKALRTGLRRDARELEVEVLDVESRADHWASLRVLDLECHGEYHGYWQRRGELLLTVAAAEPIEPPKLAS